VDAGAGKAQADIGLVGQVLVGALPVPHLAPGVARVLQDRGDRAQRPPRAGAVRVPLRAGGRRVRDLGLVQRPRDPRHRVPGEALGEDPRHHVRRLRVRLETVSCRASEDSGSCQSSVDTRP